jgi:hypothetical protein
MDQLTDIWLEAQALQCQQISIKDRKRWNRLTLMTILTKGSGRFRHSTKMNHGCGCQLGRTLLCQDYADSRPYSLLLLKLNMRYCPLSGALLHWL